MTTHLVTIYTPHITRRTPQNHNSILPYVAWHPFRPDYMRSNCLLHGAEGSSTLKY
jgi:hypothetical protein